MYTLKIYDKPLVKFNMEKKPTLKISDIEIVSDEKNIFLEILKKEVTNDTIKEFLQQRIIPRNRAFSQNILESENLDYRDTKGIIDTSKGLSLIDCY